MENFHIYDPHSSILTLCTGNSLRLEVDEQSGRSISDQVKHEALNQNLINAKDELLILDI